MITVLLRFATISIRARPYVLDVDITFLMQIAEQALKRRKHFGNVFGLFRLGIRLVRDLDVEVKATLALLAQRTATNNPIIRIDVVDRYRGDVGLFTENSGCQLEQNAGNLPGHLRRSGGTDFHIEDGHDELQLVSYTTSYSKKGLIRWRNGLSAA